MITFILGEDRHVKYFVHSIGQYDYFVIKDAKFSLLHNGKQEAQQAFVQSKKTKRKMVIMLM